MKLYEVGGAVRDKFLGVKTKDVDFAVEAESYDEMKKWMEDEGFEIFVETPEFLTIRAKPPVGSSLSERTNGADFVLCRKDSPGSDGRRPDFVEVGTIFDDLARRDFTVNAMAIDVETGDLIDPHGGMDDLAHKTLRFVGDPYARVREDGLRVMRGFRFEVMKGLRADRVTGSVLRSEFGAKMLSGVSIERVREELERMLRFDTMASFVLLRKMEEHTVRAILRDGLRLSATMKG